MFFLGDINMGFMGYKTNIMDYGGKMGLYPIAMVKGIGDETRYDWDQRMRCQRTGDGIGGEGIVWEYYGNVPCLAVPIYKLNYHQ